MTRLPALEHDFQAYVRLRTGAMEARVVGSARADAKQRLEVYAEAYRLRLIDVLGDDYPGVRLLAGEDGFTALGEAFIAAHPSKHFNARWFGAGLAAFLAGQAPWSGEPALAEMAGLEWAMTLVFDHADESVAGVADAAAIPPQDWGAMQVVPGGAQRRVTLSWNVGAIRQALDQGAAPPAAQRLAQPETWLVWRRSFEVYYRPLAGDEAAALAAAHEGRTFAELCEALSQGEDAALRAAGLLRRWLEDGLVLALQPGTGADD